MNGWMGGWMNEWEKEGGGDEEGRKEKVKPIASFPVPHPACSLLEVNQKLGGGTGNEAIKSLPIVNNKSSTLAT